LKGVYARNRLPRRLNVPSALVENTDPDDRPGTHWVALYIDANSRGEYYDPTGRPPFLRAGNIQYSLGIRMQTFLDGVTI
jgi:hypothetical protein